MTDDSTEIDRRTVLEKTGAAAAGVTSLAGVAGARPNGDGNGGGPPFLDPSYEDIVFCGCSQVCVCNLPGNCEKAKVVFKDTDIEEEFDSLPTIEEGECYSGDEIVGIVDDVPQNDYTFLVCNPNTACSGSDERSCQEVGTAPQFGAKCGGAFLEECTVE